MDESNVTREELLSAARELAAALTPWELARCIRDACAAADHRPHGDEEQ